MLYRRTFEKTSEVYLPFGRYLTFREPQSSRRYADQGGRNGLFYSLPPLGISALGTSPLSYKIMNLYPASSLYSHLFLPSTA